jgi:hypothetical protein
MREYHIKAITPIKKWVIRFEITAHNYNKAINHIDETSEIKGLKFCLIQIKSLHL